MISGDPEERSCDTRSLFPQHQKMSAYLISCLLPVLQHSSFTHLPSLPVLVLYVNTPLGIYSPTASQLPMCMPSSWHSAFSWKQSLNCEHDNWHFRPRPQKTAERQKKVFYAQFTALLSPCLWPSSPHTPSLYHIWKTVFRRGQDLPGAQKVNVLVMSQHDTIKPLKCFQYPKLYHFQSISLHLETRQNSWIRQIH